MQNNDNAQNFLHSMSSTSANIPIVVVCYNRPGSLLRVLASLVNAKYPARNVKLIISIDYSNYQLSMVEIAEQFIWPFGDKEVRVFDCRQGLRSHILQCGDLSLEYEGIIVLEDDVIVGENYYRFALDAVCAVGSDPRIAGISLYAPDINEMSAMPFRPAPSKFDAYFLQSSQSWGQCWTSSMWRGFRDWYGSSNSRLLDDFDMPLQIYSWPETSWKKYHMKYTVENAMTWLYPYVSHTSNCSDVGVHNPRPSFLFQVALSSGDVDFLLPLFGDHAAVYYDVFFERSDLVDEDGVPLLLDLYCTRRRIPKGRRFVSGRLTDQTPVRRYGLLLRPHDQNVACHISGEELISYDADRHIELEGKASIRQRVYHSNLTWVDALRVGIYGLCIATPDKIRRLLRKLGKWTKGGR